MPIVRNLFETQTGNLGLWSPVQIKGLGTHEIHLQGINIFPQTLIIQWANIIFHIVLQPKERIKRIIIIIFE